MQREPIMALTPRYRVCPSFSSFQPRQRVYRQAFAQLQALGGVVSVLLVKNLGVNK